MLRAIEVARMSEAEDDRLHPRVGAVLADQEGNEIMFSFRGQGGTGGHAEYNLLEQAERDEISLADKILFVTLEPCSRRSPGKLPCAVRVARSGIGEIYIGTLDPNPQIIGRGVNFLIESGATVEHFPADLRKELMDMNASFRGQHAYLVDPIVEDNSDEVAGRQRAGILATSLDLIAFAKSDVRIFSGDSSWLGELFVGLLEASLRGVDVRLLAQKPLSTAQYAHLAAIGIDVCDGVADLGLRATMAMVGGKPSQLVVVERDPATHAQLFSAPHDGSVLGTFARIFNSAWEPTRIRTSSAPQVNSIPVVEVAEALRQGVPAYRSARIGVEEVNTGDLRFLTSDVEILKLRRVASTMRIMKLLGMQAPLSIAGTPWAFFPPIVERNEDGMMVIVDGVHRVYEATQAKQGSISAIVVDNVSVRLPANPVPQFEANVLGRKRSREERYHKYDPVAFRPIRKALENGSWTRKPSVGSLRWAESSLTCGEHGMDQDPSLIPPHA